VVWLDGDRIELTGPCGPAPWMLELDRAEHPLDVVTRITRDVVGQPLLAHSTSWRRDRDAVILSFLVVVDRALAEDMGSRPVDRAELARSEASAAPADIGYVQVLEHALRHLAWLVAEDPVARQVLSEAWKRALARYTPEPFRALG